MGYLSNRAMLALFTLAPGAIVFMADRRKSDDPIRSGPDLNKVDGLAEQAIRMVAEQGRTLPRNSRADDIAALQVAALSGDRGDCQQVAAEMIARGVPRKVISDDYVPEIACSLGEEWRFDTKSFAEVTIGVSRLQSLLRDLGPEWRSDAMADPVTGTATIVVALGESHTLGAMILAGQLRRIGVSVRLQVGLRPAELRDSLDHPGFDAILISASTGEDLETLRLLVEAVRTSSRPDTPVVIGGGILSDGVDVAAVTGANFATNDPIEAIEHCGLKIPTKTAALHEPVI